MTSTTHDRGWEQVALCDPKIIGAFAVAPKKVWHRMSDLGWKDVYNPRLKAKQILRNVKDSKYVVVGPWWTQLDPNLDGTLL